MSDAKAVVTKRSVAAADGVMLDYDVIGDGEPVVMLHGLWTGRAVYSRQHELADRFRLIMPSARSHDGSDGRLPPDYGIATTELDDLLAVLDAEKLERFHLIGHSSGGTLAFALVKRFPERVRRMVLIEPTLFGVLRPAEGDAIRKVFGSFAEAGRRGGDRAGMAAAMAWLGGEAWAGLPEARRTSRLDQMAPMAHLVVPHMDALLAFDATPAHVAVLKMPTLLIYGGASYPFEGQIAARFRELRPDWRQVLVEGAGHNCYREQPAIVNAAIREFLATG